MARKLAEGGDSESDRYLPTSGRSIPLGRRGFVRFVSAVIGAIVSATGAVGASGDTPVRPDSERIRQLRIVGTGDISKYELTVDGDLAPDPSGSTDAAARVSGVSAEGVVTEGSRIYLFSGEIQDFSLEGDAGVYLQVDDSSTKMP